MNQARFEWNGTAYTIPDDTKYHKILLPTGVILNFNGFNETYPPTPQDLTERIFSITSLSIQDMAKIAEELHAVLATELGYCPDHPNEHGKFCSECGKPIHPPTPLAPKPLFPFQTNPHIFGSTSKHDFHLTVPEDVQGSGPCPNCKQPLSHDTHATSCPNCGQALHWTCRDGSNPGYNSKRNEI